MGVPGNSPTGRGGHHREGPTSKWGEKTLRLSSKAVALTGCVVATDVAVGGETVRKAVSKLSVSCLALLSPLPHPAAARLCAACARSSLATAERQTALVLLRTSSLHRALAFTPCCQHIRSAQRHATLLRDGRAVAGAFWQVSGHSRRCALVVSVVTARSGRLVPLALSLQRIFRQRFGEDESSSASLSPLPLLDAVFPACSCVIFFSMDHAAVSSPFNVLTICTRLVSKLSRSCLKAVRAPPVATALFTPHRKYRPQARTHRRRACGLEGKGGEGRRGDWVGDRLRSDGTPAK